MCALIQQILKNLLHVSGSYLHAEGVAVNQTDRTFFPHNM